MIEMVNSIAEGWFWVVVNASWQVTIVAGGNGPVFMNGPISTDLP